MELRADVDVHPGGLEPGFARAPESLEGVLRRQAELRPLVRRPDRRMRVGLDPRSDPDEDAPNAGLGGALHLVERIDDHEGGLGPGCRGQLFVALVVAVHDEPLSGHAGPQRELELAEGRDVGAHALVREQPQDGSVRKRLDPVDEERVGRSGPVRAGTEPRIVASS